MLKYILILSLLSFFITCIKANSHCRSNAVIRWHIENSDNNSDKGSMWILSGKDSQTLPTDIAMRALSDCAFRNYGCTGVWNYNQWFISCNKGGMRWAQGKGNIEFNCSDGPYTCYDFGSI